MINKFPSGSRQSRLLLDPFNIINCCINVFFLFQHGYNSSRIRRVGDSECDVCDGDEPAITRAITSWHHSSHLTILCIIKSPSILHQLPAEAASATAPIGHQQRWAQRKYWWQALGISCFISTSNEERFLRSWRPQSERQWFVRYGGLKCHWWHR